MSKTLIACALSFGFVSSAFAGVPGGSHAFGDTLEGWMVGAWEYLLGGEGEGRDGNVVYLPVPDGVPTDDDPFTLSGEADVTLGTGDAFALPMFFAIGEQYEDGWVPDPDSLDDAIFTGVTLEVTVDDRVILSSDDADLADYLVGATYFDEVIQYETPYYGATGAVWIKGLGMVGQPLSAGDHVLHLYVYSPDIGIAFDNTWNVTVD